MPKLTPLPANYNQLLAKVKERIRSAQYAALKPVNTELVGLYWDLGRMIVERQVGETWGKSVVEKLSADLQREFPAVGGFSASNLWRMKAFFELYREDEKLAPLVREIAWAHNLAIMSKCILSHLTYTEDQLVEQPAAPRRVQLTGQQRPRRSTGSTGHTRPQK